MTPKFLTDYWLLNHWPRKPGHEIVLVYKFERRKYFEWIIKLSQDVKNSADLRELSTEAKGLKCKQKTTNVNKKISSYKKKYLLFKY